MFSRLIVLVLIGGLLWFVGRRLWHEYQQQQQINATQRPKMGKMLRCNYCGVHFPEQEAIRTETEEAQVFCCVEHQQLYQQKKM